MEKPYLKFDKLEESLCSADSYDLKSNTRWIQVHVKVAIQWKACEFRYSFQYGRKPFTTIKNEKLGKETIGILSHPSMVSKIHYICQSQSHQ